MSQIATKTVASASGATEVQRDAFARRAHRSLLPWLTVLAAGLSGCASGEPSQPTPGASAGLSQPGSPEDDSEPSDPTPGASAFASEPGSGDDDPASEDPVTHDTSPGDTSPSDTGCKRTVTDTPADEPGAGASSDRFVCADDAADSDDDGLCDDAEDHYGTDPRESDTDQDGLSDGLEVRGLEADFSLGGDAPALDLRARGADPRHRDVFVEIDYYQDQVPSKEVLRATLAPVVDAYANAPVGNPDGRTGITLHLLVDQAIDPCDANPDLGRDMIPDNNADSTAVWNDVDVIRSRYFKGPNTRVYHYALLANQLSSGTTSGMSRPYFPSQDFVVTLGAWPSTWFGPLTRAGTFMHELGHTLGLRHGGGNYDDNEKPNYLSVMNYLYQTQGVGRLSATTGWNALDYARFPVGELDESSLDEQQGLVSPSVSTSKEELLSYRVAFCASRKDGKRSYAYLPGKTGGAGSAGGDLDFDRDGVISSSSVSADLNADGSTTTSYPQLPDDWTNLQYGGGDIGRIGSIGATVYAPIDPAAGPCLDHPGFLGE